MSSRNSLSIHALVVAAWLAAPAATAHAAWPHDPVLGGLPICTVPGAQNTVAATDDGAGGIIVAWADQRSGGLDIYAQRVSASGVPVWTADGVAVCTASSDQTGVRLVSDGAGGAILVWTDARSGPTDIYARRVATGGGTLWAANGIAVSTAASTQHSPDLTTDGAGGVVVAWLDDRSDAACGGAMTGPRNGLTGWPGWEERSVLVSTGKGLAADSYWSSAQPGHRLEIPHARCVMIHCPLREWGR